MSDHSDATNTVEEWQSLSLRLSVTTHRHIDELTEVQADLHRWYATKPGMASPTLELDKCPGLLRVMQIVRLLRESLAEFEQELDDQKAPVS